MTLRESLVRTLKAVNPFYRNPIWQVPDVDHLRDVAERTHLSNSHLAKDLIQSILARNENVNEAVRLLHGEFVLETAIVNYELRVNVFEVVSAAKVKIFNRLWTEESAPRFTLVTDAYRGTLEPLIGPRFGAYYDPYSPVMSWTLPLEDGELRLLGARVLLR